LPEGLVVALGGHALIRSEAAGETAYELPLDVCVAQTQGGA
jgi:hypothetical protein